MPDSMKRSMSRQAEAERERRARIITADGELQASYKLSQAAATMADTPSALQLRLLQTVVEVAAEKNSTLVLPFPVELLRFLEAHTTQAKPAAATPDRPTPELAGNARAAVESAPSEPPIRGVEADEASPAARQRQPSNDQPSPAGQPAETV